MNDETRTTRPDLFTDIKDEKVTYIETNCGGPPSPVNTQPSVTVTAGPLGTVGTLGPGATAGPNPFSIETTTSQTTRWIGGGLGGELPTLGTLAPVRCESTNATCSID